MILTLSSAALFVASAMPRPGHAAPAKIQPDGPAAGATGPADARDVSSPGAAPPSPTQSDASLRRVEGLTFDKMRRHSPGYGQTLGVAVDMSFLGVGPKLSVAPIQDIDVFGKFSTLGLFNSYSLGLSYYPLAVIADWPVQPAAMLAYHWVRFTGVADDGASFFPGWLNAGLAEADVSGVRAGFVSMGGGVQLRMCSGFQAKAYVAQNIQAPAASSSFDGQSFSFANVRFPNVGVDVGMYFRPFARRWFADATCETRRERTQRKRRLAVIR